MLWMWNMHFQKIAKKIYYSELVVLQFILFKSKNQKMTNSENDCASDDGNYWHI